MNEGERRSPLGLVILALLSEEPMHVYRMQKLIRQRGKDRVVNVRQRASLYQAIDRLLRQGLIAVKETVRSDRYPDRTVFEITERGREVAGIWLRQTLRAFEPFPEFEAGLSMVTGLTDTEAASQLEARADANVARLAEVEANLATSRDLLSRPFGPTPLVRALLLDEEYRQTMLTAELRWLKIVIADLRAGRLSWDEQQLAKLATAIEEESAT